MSLFVYYFIIFYHIFVNKDDHSSIVRFT